jgi:prepilin-type N-terminal cleavage/methylation domain-containing protein
MTGIVKAFADRRRTRTPSGAFASGFSIVELMVAMAMTSVVLAAVYTVHAALVKSYTAQNAAADAQEAIRAGMDLMAEDILMAGFDPLSASGAGIVAADAASIHFTSDRNMNGGIDASDLEEIRYFLSGTQLIQELYGNATTNAVLIDNVTNLTFAYFDGDDPPKQLLPPLPAAQLADIRTISLSITVQAPAGRGEKVTRKYTTRFRCRNMDL